MLSSCTSPPVYSWTKGHEMVVIVAVLESYVLIVMVYICIFVQDVSNHDKAPLKMVLLLGMRVYIKMKFVAHLSVFTPSKHKKLCCCRGTLRCTLSVVTTKVTFRLT